MSDNLVEGLFKTELKWVFKDAKKTRSGKLVSENGKMFLDIQTPKDKVQGLPTNDSEVSAAITPNYRATLLSPFRLSATYQEISKHATARYSPTLTIMQLFSSRKTAHKLTNITGGAPLLNQWLDVDKTGYNHANKQLKDTSPTSVKVKLAGMTVSLNVDIETSDSMDKLVVSNGNQIRIDFEKPQNYWGAIFDFKIIEDFLNFIFPIPHTVCSFQASEKNSTNTQLPLVKYIDAPHLQKYERGYGSSQRFQLLFKYQDVGDCGLLVQKWHEHYKTLSPVIDNLVFLKSVDVTDQTRFLTHVNSLEILHNNFFDRKKYTDADFKLMKARILKNTDPTDMNFIANALSFGNTLSLRNRLMDLRDTAVNVGCGGLDDQELAKVVNTRNHYIHSTHYKQADMLYPWQLPETSTKLGHYVKAVLLKVLGATDDELKAIVKSSMQFQSFYVDGRR